MDTAPPTAVAEMPVVLEEVDALKAAYFDDNAVPFS